MRRPDFALAATASLLGGALLLAGCASKPLPASPVAAPLNDHQAARLADDYLTDQQAPASRFVASVEPMGDGNLVSFRTAFDADATPPVQSRLVMVEHDGSVRELRFSRGR